MKLKRYQAALSIGIAITLTLSTAFAGNGLWVNGKDEPKRRVNVGSKVLNRDVYLNVAERYNSTVVNIRSTRVMKPPKTFWHGPNRRKKGPQSPGPMPPFDNFFNDDFFDRFFGGPQMPQPERKQQSLGSGFILNAEGYVVTNNHVVEKADEIIVALSDETEFKATIVGRDPRTDVALLKVESKKKLPHVILGDSEELRVGDVVMAIGNPFGLSHSVTQGIVSAKERTIGFGPYDDFIQTDASINPGNSGGPLLNLHGEVVGINTAIVAAASGIGFAIPINLAKNILLNLKNEGRVVRGWLGVGIQKVSEELAKQFGLKKKQGALVTEVFKDSPAEKAGLKTGDIIIDFAGKKIKKMDELPLAVANTKVNKKVRVIIFRDGKRKTFSVKIGELKGDDVAGAPEKKDDLDELLGLSVQELTDQMARSLGVEKDVKGVVVSDINTSSKAYEKGVRRGDVIVEVDRRKTPDLKAYRKVIRKKKKGKSVLLLIKRGASGTLFVAFTL